MSYQLKVIKDYPIGFWTLDESSGATAYDISGCGNHATYIGSPANNTLPLIVGGISGTKITNTAYITTPTTYDYYGSVASGGFGNKYTSDNDFTIEAWIYPKVSTANIATIFADTTNSVGLFWQNGNLIFKLNSERLDYTVANLKRVLHVVAVYSVYNMSIYVNGSMVATKSLLDFKFTNTSLNLQIGPTGHASDSFIVDAPAVYRYSLSLNKINNHLQANNSLPPIQIAYPENGQLFEFYDNGISNKFRFKYPQNKSWANFISTGLFYNSVDQYLSIEYAAEAIAKTVYITDLISIPSGITMDSSKIEWEGYNGITVETSIDNSTWVQCVNGQPIPQYRLNSFSSAGLVYIKITMSTTDNSKYLPKLYSLSLSFYNNQTLYAENGGSYMSTFESLGGVSNPSVSMGSIKHPILSRDYNNGIRVAANSGFYINSNIPTRTIEFFYTPDALTNSGLITSVSNNGYAASNFSWTDGGTISKTNINSIYVNGVNKSSATNISSVFNAEDLHHVIITYTAAIYGPIKFNYESSYQTVGSLIQNLCLYEDQFSAGNILIHYNLYLGRTAAIAEDSHIALTENSVIAYNNDWLVIQNI